MGTALIRQIDGGRQAQARLLASCLAKQSAPRLSIIHLGHYQSIIKRNPPSVFKPKIHAAAILPRARVRVRRPPKSVKQKKSGEGGALAILHADERGVPCGECLLAKLMGNIGHRSLAWTRTKHFGRKPYAIKIKRSNRNILYMATNSSSL